MSEVIPRITPAEAAEFAEAAYETRTLFDDEKANRPQQQKAQKQFLRGTGAAALLSSRTGATFKSSSGFGYIQESTKENRLLITLRGTATLADWLTNLNVGMQVGPWGHPVHAGFLEAFKPIRQTLTDYLKQRGRAPGSIHCVGHSLGGALATLTAAHLASLRVPVVLYSFGAPRVGTAKFAAEITAKVGVHNILRVSHIADVVPMVPIFPFIHQPIDGPVIHLTRDAGLLGDHAHAHAHSMPKTYSLGVRDAEWGALLTASAGKTQVGKIGDWLAASASTSVLHNSSVALAMISNALLWILDRAAKTLGLLIQAGMTVLDQLAAALHAATSLSKEIRAQLEQLVRVIFRFLGRPVQVLNDLSVAFLRWVLDLLLTSVKSIVARALALVGRRD